MTYEELKKYCVAFVEADKTYRIESEKYFPTVGSGNRIIGKSNFVPEEELFKLKNLREIRDAKEEEWHNMAIEYRKNRK